MERHEAVHLWHCNFSDHFLSDHDWNVYDLFNCLDVRNFDLADDLSDLLACTRGFTKASIKMPRLSETNTPTWLQTTMFYSASKKIFLVFESEIDTAQDHLH